MGNRGYNGVVNALILMGFILTQVPAAYYSERLRCKKWALGVILILAGFSLFFFVMVLFLNGGGNLKLMLGLFIIFYGATTIISGSATPLIGCGIMNYTSSFVLSMVLMVIAALYFVFFVNNPQGYKDMKAQTAE